MSFSAPGPHAPWDDEGLGEEGLTRRERLRMERQARHLSRPRTGLRLTAVAAVVVGVLVWLAVSWVASSPSSSEELPEGPDLGEEDRPAEQPPTDGDTSSGSADEGGEGEEPGEIVVHVAGAVGEPGVVELPAGSRVHEALEEAGGVQEDAATDALNLAEEVQDGALITVPTRQEVEDGEFVPGEAADGGEQSGGGVQQDGLIDLNRAEASELEELPGIGPALSERIVAHREQHGPFQALEDLAAVSGIGPAILADVEDLVTW